MVLQNLLWPSQAYSNSQPPQTTNIAGPTASATGSVVNQAVQVLQGPFPVMGYGNGISCPGPSLTISPFTTGNLNNNTDPYSYQSNNISAGFTLGLSFPLDGGASELCKDSARAFIARQEAETAKARLDFELVRAMRCGEMKRQGIHFHPDSPYAAVCADIVVVNNSG